jgi:hypothetical protein
LYQSPDANDCAEARQTVRAAQNAEGSAEILRRLVGGVWPSVAAALNPSEPI